MMALARQKCANAVSGQSGSFSWLMAGTGLCAARRELIIWSRGMPFTGRMRQKITACCGAMITARPAQFAESGATAMAIRKKAVEVAGITDRPLLARGGARIPN
jgi:hypothetical protein